MTSCCPLREQISGGLCVQLGAERGCERRRGQTDTRVQDVVSGLAVLQFPAELRGQRV